MGKTLMLSKIEGRGIPWDEMVGWHHRLSENTSLSKLLEMVKKRGAWGAAVHGVTKTETQLSDWIKQSWDLNEATLAPTLCLSAPIYLIAASWPDLWGIVAYSTSLVKRRIPWKGRLPSSAVCGAHRVKARFFSIIFKAPRSWPLPAAPVSPLLTVLPAWTLLHSLPLTDFFTALQRRLHPLTAMSLVFSPILLSEPRFPLFLLCDNLGFYFDSAQEKNSVTYGGKVK